MYFELYSKYKIIEGYAVLLDKSYHCTCSILLPILLGIILLLFSSNIMPSEGDEENTNEAVIVEERLESDMLGEFERGIREKTKLIYKLKQQIKKNGTDSLLEQEIEGLVSDIEVLQKNFEQVATGGVRLEMFDNKKKPQDWREELTIVVKPLLENLNHLTEKPRKKENLRRAISNYEDSFDAANEAMLSIEKSITKEDSKLVLKQLLKVKEKWEALKEDALRKKSIAEIELSALNNENSYWLSSFADSLAKFARERGLTLLLALFASLMVWGLSRLIRLLFERAGKVDFQQRTTYRVIKYAQRLVTVLLIIISIIIVFVIRGDILLLAVMAVLLFTIALGLRNFLPQFISESRVLLNIGAVRENEHVMVNNIPWRVASINVYSKLVNPEIRGVLRLPLSEMKQLISRPLSHDKWFPSSIGDWVLDDSDNLYEVLEQTPDAVELQSAQGSNKLIPTSTYYEAGYVNLTKSKTIRIVSRFGVDYSLQNICLDDVPQKMQQSVLSRLQNADIGTDNINCRVEFEQAGESSLDYIIIVKLGSGGAKNYYLIRRCIQQACVSVCNEQNWGIPFPQLTVHKQD